MVAVCCMKSDPEIKLDVPRQLINATLWISAVTCCIIVLERLSSLQDTEELGSIVILGFSK